ncbi:MAG TPA: YbaK/EbsC family protein [Thermoleophilaceae bacterium]|nr:YbaK/EbsC family protein [Thermoleophilaceae bacterium]
MREKVVESGRTLGLKIDVRYMEDSTATAQEAAGVLGCQQAQIAESLVFVADGDPVVCVASGAHRVDLDLLADTLDVAEIRQASPDEVRAATGYCVGGVPPFGHDLPVVLDEDLLGHERIWAAGGDGHSLFDVDPRRLAECTHARVARVA